MSPEPSLLQSKWPQERSLNAVVEHVGITLVIRTRRLKICMISFAEHSLGQCVLYPKELLVW